VTGTSTGISSWICQIQAIKDDWSGRINRQDPNQDDPNIDSVHCFFDPSFIRCANLTNQPE